MLISGYEHNAVCRPLAALESRGVRTVSLPFPLFEPEEAAAQFEAALDDTVGLVVCVHVSNVFGYILPVERISVLCKEKGVPLVVDAAQSAGALPIEGDSYPVWCMPGHKGLYGPQGTGLLLLPPGVLPETLIEGGTGGDSRAKHMPDFLPERLEAGTHNAPGAAGLTAGIKFARKNMGNAESGHLLRFAAEGLASIGGVRVFAAEHPEFQTGALSFTVEGKDPEAVAEHLDRQGIAVRAGLHCAPLAHNTAGTGESGTVRISFSAYSTRGDISALIRSVKKI